MLLMKVTGFRLMPGSCSHDGQGLGMLLQVKALVSLESGGVPTAYLNSQQTQREKRAIFAVSSGAHSRQHIICMQHAVVQGIAPCTASTNGVIGA